jgi:NADPH:quinone reductase-like Zn-dependent oxidoreductase
MRAAIYKKYGPPEVIHFADIPKPQPKPNEVLVKIIATTVNRTDTGFRKAEYFIIRFFAGFFKPKNQILGTEFSGIIESIGSDVKTFKIGDQVFGLNTYKFGTHAEYVCIKENGSIAIKPSNLSFEEAAAVCDGLMLAINYVRKIDFSTKPKILINGASGSIGSAAVQLCHYYGAQITAVCGTKNLELIKSLGADEVIDYTKTDFTQNGQLYDVVLDAVGKSSFFKCKKILKPKGVYFSTELGYLSQNIFLALVSPLSKGKKVGFPIPTDNQKDILEFKQIIEEGNYRAVIDNVYPFDQIVEATKYVETGQKTGNVVIRVTED